MRDVVVWLALAGGLTSLVFMLVLAVLGVVSWCRR